MCVCVCVCVCVCSSPRHVPNVQLMGQIVSPVAVGWQISYVQPTRCGRADLSPQSRGEGSILARSGRIMPNSGGLLDFHPSLGTPVCSPSPLLANQCARNEERTS